MIKKALWFLAIILIGAAALHIFDGIHESRPFAPVQPMDRIDKVEITKRISSDAPEAQENYVCLRELPESEWRQLFHGISELDYDIPFGDGLGTNIGSIAVRITYSDGNIELIGYVNSIYYHDGGFTRRHHTFAYEDFRNLLAKFTDVDLFPDWR